MASARPLEDVSDVQTCGRRVLGWNEDVLVLNQTVVTSMFRRLQQNRPLNGPADNVTTDIRSISHRPGLRGNPWSSGGHDRGAWTRGRCVC
ncbi:hypothetical protein ACOMHN_044627 [Nucella lapillus]